MRAQGKPKWLIAQTFGTSEKAIVRRIAQVDPHLRRWDLADEMTLMRRANDGASFAEIAAELARSVESVRNKWTVLMTGAPRASARVRVRSKAKSGERREPVEKPENLEGACEKHLQAILAANPNGFLAWSEKRVGLRGIAPCAPIFHPMRRAA